MSFLEQKARDLSMPALNALGRGLSRLGLSPDTITHAGLLLTMGVATLAALGYIRWAGLVLILAGTMDSLDGALARVSGKGSRFGAFLDSTLDRFEEALVFLGLAIHYARVGGGKWEIPIILVATIGSLMVSYTRARAEGLGVACKEGLATRPIRVLVMVVGMIAEQVLIAVSIVAAASLFTSFHRIYHVWRVTGGEPGHWRPLEKPYVIPGSQPTEPDDKAENQPPL